MEEDDSEESEGTLRPMQLSQVSQSSKYKLHYIHLCAVKSNEKLNHAAYTFKNFNSGIIPMHLYIT